MLRQERGAEQSGAAGRPARLRPHIRDQRAARGRAQPRLDLARHQQAPRGHAERRDRRQRQGTAECERRQQPRRHRLPEHTRGRPEHGALVGRAARRDQQRERQERTLAVARVLHARRKLPVDHHAAAVDDDAGSARRSGGRSSEVGRAAPGAQGDHDQCRDHGRVVGDAGGQGKCFKMRYCVFCADYFYYQLFSSTFKY